MGARRLKIALLIKKKELNVERNVYIAFINVTPASVQKSFK